MGFFGRIRNGMANAIKSDSGLTPTDRSAQPIDVHALKMATGGFSQPVWGPEINTVGQYSREGYTSRTFDIPVQPFNKLVFAMETDEDVQLAINHLSSQVTGGAHYWKGADDNITEYITQFSKDIDFDWIDTILVKELLAYGNSVWKPRLGINNIRSKDDIMHIPISSFVRIWWDRARKPYKYEFRGSEYQGYHNPDELMHFVWNPVDASAFGLGLLVAMVAPRQFEQVGVDGGEVMSLPSMLDRKYSTQLTMHLTERRYIPRNAFIAEDAEEDERAQLRGDLRNLSPNEDFVFGKNVKVQELGAVQRAFDPTLFNDNVEGPIMRALNDFRGKQGSESSHQYANAKTSAVLDEIGLASFPLAVTIQLIDKLFKPWYESQPLPNPQFAGSIFEEQFPLSWNECEYELNFGEVEKVDTDPKELLEMIKMGAELGAVTDPIELRDLLERAGLPLSKEYTERMNTMYNDPTGQLALQNLNLPTDPQFGSNGGGPWWDTTGMDQAPRPMDNAIYNDMMVNPRPTDPRLNFTVKKKK